MSPNPTNARANDITHRMREGTRSKRDTGFDDFLSVPLFSIFAIV
jgi:hypothetical protein